MDNRHRADEAVVVPADIANRKCHATYPACGHLAGESLLAASPAKDTTRIRAGVFLAHELRPCRWPGRKTGYGSLATMLEPMHSVSRRRSWWPLCAAVLLGSLLATPAVGQDTMLPEVVRLPPIEAEVPIRLPPVIQADSPIFGNPPDRLCCCRPRPMDRPIFPTRAIRIRPTS